MKYTKEVDAHGRYFFHTRTALLSLAGTVLLALILTACGDSQTPEMQTQATALELAAAVVENQAELPAMTAVSMGEEDFSLYVSSYYDLDEGTLEDGVVCYAGGVEASEITVLLLKDEADAERTEETLLSYREGRANDFLGYVPDQAAMAENGLVSIQGRYVALLICADPAGARESLLACFVESWTPPDTAEVFGEPVLEPKPQSSETPDAETTIPQEETHVAEIRQPTAETPEPEPTEKTENTAPIPTPAPTPALTPTPTPAPAMDAYDHEAVLAAWVGGDPSALSDKNRAIYDAATSVISQVIVTGMKPYEQELAIHNYIAANGKYDPEIHSHAPDASPDPDNDNPYGMLVNGVGICRGYSTTFQLFMDMLGIKCITVPGSSGGDEHAWNMVRLDEEWYCVDVTWDDPTGGTPQHRYFNVTSQFLRDTNHQWNEDSIPEATATVYSWSVN